MMTLKFFTGCGITGFPAFQDTQKLPESQFLTKVSDWKAAKIQCFGKTDSPYPLGQAERAA